MPPSSDPMTTVINPGSESTSNAGMTTDATQDSDITGELSTGTVDGSGGATDDASIISVSKTVSIFALVSALMNRLSPNYAFPRKARGCCGLRIFA